MSKSTAAPNSDVHLGTALVSAAEQKMEQEGTPARFNKDAERNSGETQANGEQISIPLRFRFYRSMCGMPKLKSQTIC